jgi:hypothetical protein
MESTCQCNVELSRRVTRDNSRVLRAFEIVAGICNILAIVS